MFSCAEVLPTLARHALRPMTMVVQPAALVRPMTAEQPTLLVLRRGHVSLLPRHGANPRPFTAGWATLDPSFADYAQERWTTREETLYHAVELPVQASEALLQREAPWARSGQPPFRFSDPRVSWWVEEMVAHCAAGEPHGALYTESVGLALLSYLLSRTTPRALPPQRAAALPEHSIRKIQDHVDGNLTGELSLKDIAELCGYSPGHLNRVFRAAVGMPLHRFVIERRLEEARRLLARDDSPIAEIALACGFANQAHFSTAFKRYMGCTPRAFRSAAGAAR